MSSCYNTGPWNSLTSVSIFPDLNGSRLMTFLVLLFLSNSKFARLTNASLEVQAM